MAANTFSLYWSLAVKIGKRFFSAEGMVYAGYLTFLSLLGLVPLFAVMFWAGQQSDWMKEGEQALRTFMLTNFFPDAAKQVLQILDKLRANARSLGNTGVVLLIADLVLKAQALGMAFERIEKPRSEAGAWRSIYRAAPIIMLVVPTVVAVVFISIQFIEQVFLTLLPMWKTGVHALFKWPLMMLPLWLGLWVLYRLTLRVNGGWARTAVVAMVVTVVIEITRFILVDYLILTATVKSLYGSFTTLPLLLMSLFLFWLWVLLGAAYLVETASPGKAKKT
jgi:membrane protein